jgi:hypothetical protein
MQQSTRLRGRYGPVSTDPRDQQQQQQHAAAASPVAAGQPRRRLGFENYSDNADAQLYEQQHQQRSVAEASVAAAAASSSSSAAAAADPPRPPSSSWQQVMDWSTAPERHRDVLSCVTFFKPFSRYILFDVL